MRQAGIAIAVAAILACAPAEQVAGPSERPAPSRTQEAVSGGTAGAMPSPAPSEDVLLYAVGDIASCRVTADERVAALLARRRGTIAILGDAVYDRGTRAEYRECFDPAWGPLRARLRPAPGNHDYQTPGAAGYFDYFGRRAGPSGKGWYRHDLGEHWRVIALNSNCVAVGGCETSSPQGRWLARTLATSGQRHILAYWHAPLFSSGRHGPNPVVRPLWEALQRAGADIVLAGHDHSYERFAPQDADGRRRPGGIRQFTVGTGGYSHYAFARRPLATTEVRDSSSFGVLRLRLQPDGYRWRFVPATGSFTDRGHQAL